MTNYSMEGRTYRYFRGPGDPLYPFGYGLSYSSFQYTNLSLSGVSVRRGESVTVMCTVRNTGLYDADEVGSWGGLYGTGLCLESCNVYCKEYTAVGG